MEQKETKFRIVICELYHSFLHGTDNSSKLEGQILVIDTFRNFYNDPNSDSNSDSNSESDSSYNSDSDSDSDSFDANNDNDSLFEEDNFDILTLCVELHREKYQELLETPRFLSTRHKIIRNYHHIVRQPYYIQPQIAECYYFHNKECVCVLKTFWIRLVQRTWKRICKERKSMIQRRTMISSLNHREIHGRWPEGLNVLPSIYGMLSYII